MKSLRASAVGLSLVAIALSGPAAKANGPDNDKIPGSITVAFGAGLNTATRQHAESPHHPAGVQGSHHECQEAQWRSRDRSGHRQLHRRRLPLAVGLSGGRGAWRHRRAHWGTFLNYDVNVFAKGVFPGNPPAFADADKFPLLATQNRTDSFGFSTPGSYLVICNVRGHFVDGMYAWIRVVSDDDDD